jgi:hypothetical protein
VIRTKLASRRHEIVHGEMLVPVRGGVHARCRVLCEAAAQDLKPTGCMRLSRRIGHGVSCWMHGLVSWLVRPGRMHAGGIPGSGVRVLVVSGVSYPSCIYMLR